MEPFALIEGRSDDFEDTAQREKIDTVAKSRRHASPTANLGTFTGYRIGLDIGNGNIGWCILFEERSQESLRLSFLTAEDIVAHNASLPKSEKRTQLPDLKDFVPLGTHKFEARDSQQGSKSLSKIRAESKSARRMLDARQRRRLHVRKALQEANLLPKDNEDIEGHTTIKADVLREKLLDSSFPAYRHDLGRALYNALKRRGLMKPRGRIGDDEDSGFAKQADARYRKALAQHECRTIGEFLQRCARDARRDGVVNFRQRHKTLAWQKSNIKGVPNLATVKSYECFRSLSPTFSLIWDECETLRRSAKLSIDETAWAKIKEAAEYRRPLKAKIPGRCEYFKDKFRCVRALPSFQRFRSLERINHLRDQYGKELDAQSFEAAKRLLAQHDKMSLMEISKELGIRLKRDKGDDTGSRFLIGAKTDIALTEVFGNRWIELPIERRDDWIMRFLRRFWPPESGKKFPAWEQSDEDALERDATAAFGPDALTKVDDEVAKNLDDTFSSMSVEAARLLAECYEKRMSYEERLDELRKHGARESVLPIYGKLPYYGEVMPDLVIPAEGFAPAARTVQDELDHGRAANPDVHVVMNRVRAVVNAIIDMMGGILPTACVIEMARSAFSEEQANAYSQTAKDRRNLRERIVAKIKDMLGPSMPTGPRLDRLVDRWKAAIRQGWRDYDGSLILPSALIDGNEYQLDHVMPAAFGDFRENNMFVSRFNPQKGRNLPFEAPFATDPKFRPALIAFATFGLQQQIKRLETSLSSTKVPRKRRESLQRALDRTRADLERLTADDTPHPEVLNALNRTLTSDLDALLDADVDSNVQSRSKQKARLFSPSDQAALFRRFYWKRNEIESEPAARDAANIGWNTKLARRYVRHLGAESEAIKAWAPHALRCMFNIDKDRRDLRNHAVDAFLVAHFDKYVLLPALNHLRHQLPYEKLYDPGALNWALSKVAKGKHFFEDFIHNLDCLDRTLPSIGTAHRADHQWNPYDNIVETFGVFGGENIYSFRPTLEQRQELTALLRKAGESVDKPAMTRKEILEFLVASPPADYQKQHEKLTAMVQLRYHSRNGASSKATTLKYQSALALSSQKGAFIDGQSKFAVVGAPEKSERRVIPVCDFSRMSKEEKASLFDTGYPIYRSHDMVIKDDKAFVVTGLQADTRLIVYPLDDATRDKSVKDWITPASDVKKLPNDILGRRIHRLRKTPGGLKPMPYPPRGK